MERPRIVLVDADAEGALAVVARLRERLIDAGETDIILATESSDLAGNADAARHGQEGSIYLRPVDVPALLCQVERLCGATSGIGDHGDQTMPPSRPITMPPQARAAGIPPSLPPPSMRASVAAIAGFEAPASQRNSPSSDTAVDSTRSRSLELSPAHFSPELSELLSDAEERLRDSREEFSGSLSPEEEIEAVLPAELLAALDEPIEEDDAEDESAAWLRNDGAERASEPFMRAEHRTGSRTSGFSSDPSGSTGIHANSSGPVLGQSSPDDQPHAMPTEPTEDGGVFAPHRALESFPPTVAPYDAIAVVARAIANRATGTMTFTNFEAIRRLTFRDGDLFTASSNASDESLVAFLGVRGDLPPETLRRLGSRFPAYGRHAGAALVARGYLRQDQMWPTLRAHSEWLLGRFFEISSARLTVEPSSLDRASREPGVFGGSTGASVFVDVVRRVISPNDARDRVGGLDARFVAGDTLDLLEECALDSLSIELVRTSLGGSLAEVFDRSADDGIAAVLFALSQLGVIRVVTAPADMRLRRRESSSPGPASLADIEADESALRERVRARLQLVDEGDYFAVLGVARTATGYEIRRAFLDLRRAFEPARVLTPSLADLDADLRTITSVLEEAYDVLKDSVHRERYRRAIEMPGG